MATAHQLSKVDTIYRSVLLSKFFSKGWGDLDSMKRIFELRKVISNRAECQQLVSPDYPITIDGLVESGPNYHLYEGHFTSPLVKYASKLIPEEAQVAKFQLLLPKRWSHSQLKPLVVHLAGTGDHYFWRRRNWMAKPLLKESGIASLILENPFYGCRKPALQKRSSLLNVSDIFVMGGCLILECLAIFHWAERQGFGPLCVHGISMGGHNASLAGTNWHKPLGIVPCLSWTTASCVFTQGVMSGSVPWDLLLEQYRAYGEREIAEVKKLIVSPENSEMFTAGRSFAKDIATEGSQDEIVSFLERIGIANVLSSSKGKNEQDKRTTAQQRNDAFDFMRGIMDECTHLGNFSVPVDPTLAIIVQATHDAYVPRSNLIALDQIWPGSSVRPIDGGHISAILLKNKVFREAIFDSLELAANKYHNTSLKETVEPIHKDDYEEQYSFLFNDASKSSTQEKTTVDPKACKRHLPHCNLANVRAKDMTALNMISCTCEEKPQE